MQYKSLILSSNVLFSYMKTHVYSSKAFLFYELVFSVIRYQKLKMADVVNFLANEFNMSNKVLSNNHKLSRIC